MAGTPPNEQSQELVLVKKTQRWVFRYRPGEEQEILRELVDAARDPATDFDWFDAAVLSHELGGQLSKRLQSTAPRKAS